MTSIIKVQILIGFIILTLLTWATQTVCRYNFVLDKKKYNEHLKKENIKFINACFSNRN